MSFPSAGDGFIREPRLSTTPRLAVTGTAGLVSAF